MVSLTTEREAGTEVDLGGKRVLIFSHCRLDLQIASYSMYSLWRLLSHSMVFSRSIHVVASTSSSCLYHWGAFPCRTTPSCPVGGCGYLHCFQFGDTMSKGAMNVLHISLFVGLCFHFSWIDTRIGIAGS